MKTIVVKWNRPNDQQNCGKTKNLNYFKENTRYEWTIGRKSIIRGYVNIMEESLNAAQLLNNQLLAMLPEHERENALNWYEQELERVEEAKLEAEAHLEERKADSADPQVAEIRAKMASAEIKARQLEMEEERRKKRFAKQLEIKHKFDQARNDAERVEFEDNERRKTQEAKDEAHSLRQKRKTLRRYETLFITMTLNLYPIVSVIR